jgi:hypothetical protein
MPGLDSPLVAQTATFAASRVFATALRSRRLATRQSWRIAPQGGPSLLFICSQPPPPLKCRNSSLRILCEAASYSARLGLQVLSPAANRCCQGTAFRFEALQARKPFEYSTASHCQPLVWRPAVCCARLHPTSSGRGLEHSIFSGAGGSLQMRESPSHGNGIS